MRRGATVPRFNENAGVCFECTVCHSCGFDTFFAPHRERRYQKREALLPLGGTRMGETHLEYRRHDGMFHSSG